ncbi:dihydrolipoyl dehydrogenase [Simiduia sp. 21SJ11W-1]|uniref:dihydrolipoyl dehydrogenase n=1 Tax=Simiduia sp. 21SJ11W-1 TaxID=2909669 RepID=UPI00209E3317|nr:dihydrolipoyl dehydrogenase [Simiduia sp. 21SJ11W-1]UTA47624.1 dihydrolipoyl dehydrogenase [Simiduia sp. 21SJ11W-1]
MTRKQTDIAIIGAGTAGLGAYRAARAFTDNLLLIEGGPYGTTCARVGCMPSKLLIAAAEQAYHHQHNGVFGVDYAPPHIDGAAVMARVRRERDRFAGFVVEDITQFPAEHKLKGQARFIDAHTLAVQLPDGQQLQVQAKRIVIATGSSPHIPDPLKAAADRLLVNDDVFELASLPRSVAVFGPGVIGLELGQALARLGVRVCVFGRSGKLATLSEPELRAKAIAQFNKEFYLDTEARVHHIARTGEAVEIRYQHAQRGEVTETFDYLLAATGRQPNLSGLALENAGLECDERGTPKHNRHTGQCGNSHIFIAGDATNDLPLLHEAADEGKTAGTNAGRSLADMNDVRVEPRRTPMSVVFTEPQIATVGMTLNTLKQQYPGCYATGAVSFENQGRARVMHKNVGAARVYGQHGTGLLLGAELFGPAAEHMAHQLAWVIQMRMTVEQILALPFYHPVLEEGLRTALRDLNHKLSIGPELTANCIDCGPGA